MAAGFRFRVQDMRSCGRISTQRVRTQHPDAHCTMQRLFLLLLVVFAAAHAFVVPSVGLPPALLATAARAPPCAIVAKESEISVSPLQGLVTAGGLVGILGGVYTTSTGSPPTGLAIAIVTLLAMYAGAAAVEAQGE